MNRVDRLEILVVRFSGALREARKPVGLWVFLVGALFENSIVCQVFYVLNSSPTGMVFVGGFFLLISLSTIIFLS